MLTVFRILGRMQRYLIHRSPLTTAREILKLRSPVCNSLRFRGYSFIARHTISSRPKVT